ncbi:MAG: alpha/beta family hydrolase [Sneathiella sp.]
MPTTKELSFNIPSGDTVSAILRQPVKSVGLFVLGHGSGSTMRVPLMAELSEALFELNVATLRFQYPYSGQSEFVPFTDMPMDSDEVLIETIRAALDLANIESGENPTYIGGHSVSGLMTTRADSDQPLPADGIICLSYPRKGDPSRSKHLALTSLPILIIQGTEDTLGTPAEISEMVEMLGEKASLKWIEGAGHVFQVKDRDIRTVTSNIARHIHDHIISAQYSQKYEKEP